MMTRDIFFRTTMKTIIAMMCLSIIVAIVLGCLALLMFLPQPYGLFIFLGTLCFAAIWFIFYCIEDIHSYW